VTDLDIWHSAARSRGLRAAILIQRHGATDAALVAAQRADEFKAESGDDGYEISKAIVEAILEVMRGAPEGDERVN
jgi:hypothetical protein